MTGENSLDSLPAASLQIHEELWNAGEKISGVLSWAQAVAVWLVSLPVVFGFSLAWKQVLTYAYLDLFAGGAIFVVTGALTVVEAHRAKAVLDEWEERMLPFFYTVKFELLPVQESTREQDIWKRYQSLYESLPRSDKTGTLMIGGSTKVQFNAEVKGKKGKHDFAIFGRKDTEMVLLVKRYSGELPVGLEQIRLLRDEAEDVIRYLRPDNHVVAAFSRSGFTNEAIEFAKSEDSMVNDAWIDLVQETQSGYKVISVLTD